MINNEYSALGSYDEDSWDILLILGALVDFPKQCLQRSQIRTNERFWWINLDGKKPLNIN